MLVRLSTSQLYHIITSTTLPTPFNTIYMQPAVSEPDTLHENIHDPLYVVQDCMRPVCLLFELHLVRLAPEIRYHLAI